jgi:hypothetical protein
VQGSFSSVFPNRKVRHCWSVYIDFCGIIV